MNEIRISKKLIDESILKDASAYINTLLEEVESDTCLVFEKDTYEFQSEYAKEQYCYITNNDHSLKRIAFSMKEKKNIVIDGNGSEFIMVGRTLPMLFETCHNIVLKNFVIDYKRPFFSQGEILEATDTYVKLKIDKKEFPYEIKDGVIYFIGQDYEENFIHDLLEFDKSVKRPAYKSLDNFKDAPIFAEEVEEGIVILQYDFEQLLNVGNILTIKHERRLIPGIVFDHSKEIQVQNVHIKHAGTMAFIAQFCENITLNSVKVATDSHSQRVVSANADATHFVGCRGTVVVENCVFESQLDDAFNVHGNYLIIKDIISNNQVLAEIGHIQQVGIFGLEPGGRIEFLEKDTMLGVTCATLKDKKIINNKYVLLTFVEDINLDLNKQYCLDDCDSYPAVIFRKNIVRHNRARGLLLTTKKDILVEENIFDTEGAALKISGDMDFWYEACGTSNVRVLNNKITTTCNYNWGRGVIDIDPEMEVLVADRYYHKIIQIENNIIEPKERPVIFGKSIEKIIFRNNQIIGNVSVKYEVENVGEIEE